MSGSDSDTIEDVTRVMQIGSGILFMGLALVLILLNSGSVLAAQTMALPQRLNMVSAMVILVCMFSSFWNFFQLTELDDVSIPQSENFVLDMSRPFEWICTCPLMQLVLVIIGGASIPSYRCIFMPCLSIIVLLFGVASTLLSNSAARVAMYICGAIVALIMFSFNWKQIQEVSVLKKDTYEFKVATLILILTWFPFPIWYLLSPEGLDVIQDAAVIHTGWAALNVFAKFSFIIYVSKIKFIRSREFKDREVGQDQSWYCPRKQRYIQEDEIDLESLVAETLTFLGIHHSASKLMGLLKQAGVTTVDALDTMDQLAWQELMLPAGLIYAAQQRLRARRNGAAEQEATKSGTHVLTEAIAQARGAADVGKLKRAVADAQTAGADDNILDIANSKLELLQGWKVMAEYVAKSFSSLLHGHDMAELRAALSVAQVAGHSDLVEKGKAKLIEEELRAKKVAKFVQDGNAHFKSKNYEDARLAYDQALALHADDATTLLNRSNTNRLLGDWRGAEEDARRSLELKPERVAAHRARALALHKLGRSEEALEECDAGLALNPKDSSMISAKKLVEAGELTPRASAAQGETTPRLEQEPTENTWRQITPQSDQSLGSTTTGTKGGTAGDAGVIRI